MAGQKYLADRHIFAIIILQLEMQILGDGKKDKLKKVLKAPVPQELKGKLLDELRNS